MPNSSAIAVAKISGPLAHLVEHLICTEGVAGSNPVRSTLRSLQMQQATRGKPPYIILESV